MAWPSSVYFDLTRYDALIIDDLGYVQQNREEMEVLFSLLAARYERGSVLVTSNLPFSKWELIFKDPMTTAAAIDRLVHHSVILELNLPSYRLEHSKHTDRPELEDRAEEATEDATKALTGTGSPPGESGSRRKKRHPEGDNGREI